MFTFDFFVTGLARRWWPYYGSHSWYCKSFGSAVQAGWICFTFLTLLSSYGSLLPSLSFIVLDSRQGGVLLFRGIYLYNDGIILFIRTAIILVDEYLQVVLTHSNFNHVDFIPLAIVDKFLTLSGGWMMVGSARVTS